MCRRVGTQDDKVRFRRKGPGYCLVAFLNLRARACLKRRDVATTRSTEDVPTARLGTRVEPPFGTSLRELGWNLPSDGYLRTAVSGFLVPRPVGNSTRTCGCRGRVHGVLLAHRSRMDFIRLVPLVPLATLTIVCATACGGWHGDPPGETGGCIQAGGAVPGATPEAPLDEIQAAVAGSALRMFVTRTAWMIEPPTVGWTSPGCASLTGGDLDADGYPDATNGSITLDSCQRPAYGGTVVADGTFAIHDLDTAIASFPHQGSGAISLAQPGLPPATWAVTLDGAPTPGKGPQMNSQQQHTLVYEPGGEILREEASVLAIYDAADQTWDGGLLEVGWFYPYGTWGIELAANLKTLEIGDLSFANVDPTCPERVVSGEVSARYLIPTGVFSSDCGGGEYADEYVLSVSWSGCGVATISHTYMGEILN